MLAFPNNSDLVTKVVGQSVDFITSFSPSRWIKDLDVRLGVISKACFGETGATVISQMGMRTCCFTAVFCGLPSALSGLFPSLASPWTVASIDLVGIATVSSCCFENKATLDSSEAERQELIYSLFYAMTHGLLTSAAVELSRNSFSCSAIHLGAIAIALVGLRLSQSKSPEKSE